MFYSIFYLLFCASLVAAQSTGSDTTLIVATVVLVFFLCLIGMAIYYFFWRKKIMKLQERIKKKKEKRERKKHKKEKKEKKEERKQQTTDYTNSTTINVTVHEVSIPGFLLIEEKKDYLLGEKVDKGGGSDIKECQILSEELFERTKGTPVIAKVLKGVQQLEDLSEKKKKAFYQEIALTWRFRDHENFPKLFGYSEKPVMMMMKYYHIGPLYDLIMKKNYFKNNSHRAKYTRRLIVSLLKQISLAVEYMHECGYAHCDIKPENVLLDERADGSMFPLLCDFGLCQFIEPEKRLVQAFQPSQINGGSYPYAAPEIFDSEIFEKRQIEMSLFLPKRDTYSMAMMIVAFLTTHTPWHQPFKQPNRRK